VTSGVLLAYDGWACSIEEVCIKMRSSISSKGKKLVRSLNLPLRAESLHKELLVYKMS
jgi:hypothetical protein